MPLKLPNLDDRNFTDLVDEAVAMLPRCAPEWTNRNPSDPGMTLIELLAYFTEMLIYRLNRVTRENKISFLQLLREVPSAERHHLAHGPVAEVDEALSRAVLDLRQPQRAVTCQDYEYLARQLYLDDPEMPKVARALCMARRDLAQHDAPSHGADRPGHVSLVLVPDRDLAPNALKGLVEDVAAALDGKRLLATRLHVVEPHYLWVTLSYAVRTEPGIRVDDVREKIEARVRGYFNPLSGGGPTGDGWPFGRGLHLAEVFEQIESVDGVDYVRHIRVLNLSTVEKSLKEVRTAIGIQIGVTSTVGADSRIGCEIEIDSERLILDGAGKLMGIALRPYELVRIKLHMDDRDAEPPPTPEGGPEAEREVEAAVIGEVEREVEAAEIEAAGLGVAVVAEAKAGAEPEVGSEPEDDLQEGPEPPVIPARERAVSRREAGRGRSRLVDEQPQRGLYLIGKGNAAEMADDEAGDDEAGDDEAGDDRRPEHAVDTDKEA